MNTIRTRLITLLTVMALLLATVPAMAIMPPGRHLGTDQKNMDEYAEQRMQHMKIILDDLNDAQQELQQQYRQLQKNVREIRKQLQG